MFSKNLFLTFEICVLLGLIVGQGEATVYAPGSVPAPGQTSRPNCVPLGSKCYEFGNGDLQQNWFQSEAYCRRNGGYLATIQNEAELNLIQNYLVNTYDGGQTRFSIDGTDLADEGVFRSLRTGNALPFTVWAPNEPNNSGGNEDCAEIRITGGTTLRMNDYNCANSLSYICEYALANSYHQGYPGYQSYYG